MSITYVGDDTCYEYQSGTYRISFDYYDPDGDVGAITSNFHLTIDWRSLDGQWHSGGGHRFTRYGNGFSGNMFADDFCIFLNYYSSQYEVSMFLEDDEGNVGSSSKVI